MSRRKRKVQRASLAVVRPERSEGSRSESSRSGGGITEAPAAACGQAPDPEVSEKAKRWQFTAKYKARILREADQCRKPGEVGTLLRREGLYSSHLTAWRKARDRGQLQALSPKKRGRKLEPATVPAKEYDRVRRENERLLQKLEQAELVIDVQKKLSQILGIPLDGPDDDGSGS